MCLTHQEENMQSAVSLSLRRMTELLFRKAGMHLNLICDWDNLTVGK